MPGQLKPCWCVFRFVAELNSCGVILAWCRAIGLMRQSDWDRDSCLKLIESSESLNQSEFESNEMQNMQSGATLLLMYPFEFCKLFTGSWWFQLVQFSLVLSQNQSKGTESFDRAWLDSCNFPPTRNFIFKGYTCVWVWVWRFAKDEPVEPPLTPDAMPASASGKSTGGGAASAPEPPHGVDLGESYQPRKCRRCGCLAWYLNLNFKFKFSSYLKKSQRYRRYHFTAFHSIFISLPFDLLMIMGCSAMIYYSLSNR